MNFLTLLVFNKSPLQYESPLAVVKVKVLEKVLFLLGFEVKRQKGSHIFYRHPDGRYTTLPHHGNQEIGRSLLRQILREIDTSPEEFQKVMQKI